MSADFRFSILNARIVRLIFLLYLSSLVPCIYGQSTPSAIPTKIRVEVDLVTVEVYAVDGKGDPVRHLTKDDFRLYEDGKRQEIVSFDAVDGDAVPEPSAMPILDSGNGPRGKTVLIVFDESSIPSMEAQRIRDSASEFVRRHMRPRDLFAVASWMLNMRILQNLTDDREAVLAAISRAALGYGFGDFQVLLQSLEQMNYSLASIKGQKTVLIYGRPSPLWPQSSLSDAYNKTIASAKKSNVVYYAIDPGSRVPGAPESFGLTITPPGSENAGNQGALLPPLKIPVATYGINSLVADTGGFLIPSLADADIRLDALDRQISSYYILGFQSGNPVHDGDFRRLRVTTSVKGVQLKHKPGYQGRRPIDVLESSKREQALQDALAEPGQSARLPVSFRPAYFYDSTTAVRVLISANIRTDKIAFNRKGAQMNADLNIMGAAYAENGSIAARFSETLPVAYNRDRETEFLRRGLFYRNYFRLRPGKYRLKLAVSDENNNIGTMEQSLDIPAPPAQGMACSSLVIVEQASTIPDLIQQLQARLQDGADPLLFSSRQIQPSVENRLQVGSPVSVLFRLYNLPAPPQQLDLRLKAKLTDEKGKDFALPPISIKNSLAVTGRSEAAISLILPFQPVLPGKYVLTIEILESTFAQSITLRTPLDFTNSVF